MTPHKNKTKQDTQEQHSAHDKHAESRTEGSRSLATKLMYDPRYGQRFELGRGCRFLFAEALGWLLGPKKVASFQWAMQ